MLALVSFSSYSLPCQITLANVNRLIINVNANITLPEEFPSPGSLGSSIVTDKGERDGDEACGVDEEAIYSPAAMLPLPLTLVTLTVALFCFFMQSNTVQLSSLSHFTAAVSTFLFLKARFFCLAAYKNLVLGSLAC